MKTIPSKMKPTGNIGPLILCGALMVAILPFLPTSAFADSNCPPPPPDPEEPHNPGGANDPAYMLHDYAPNVPISRQRAALARRTLGEVEENPMAESERLALAEVTQRIAGDPDAAYDTVLEVWGQGYSPSFQRVVIVTAMDRVTSSHEHGLMDRMLEALDDPEGAIEECLRLGRGNTLERNRGAKQLEMLRQNPRIAEIIENH